MRINDRGPFIEGRIIDLSYGAAKKIGLDADGIAPVTVRVVDRRGEPEPKPRARVPEPPAPVVRDPEPPPEEGCWWVQVGAFSEIENARRARERLAAAGEPAVVMEGPRRLERVRAGPYSTEDAAAAARSRLLLDWPEAAVVPCG